MSNDQNPARVLAVQAAALDAGGTDPGKPGWVQLLPAGTFYGIDGRGPYHVRNPEAVIALTRDKTGGNDLPVDIGHALEVPGAAGDGAPAAGWIGRLEARNGGELWGFATWTEATAAKLRNREYRFLSPVFMHDEGGAIMWLMRAGLTNRPNLPQMKSINAQGWNVTELQNALQQLAQKLGLPLTATVTELMQAVEGRAAMDPAQFVPRQQFEQVQHALRTLSAESGQRAVERAVEAGKVPPAMRAWATAYHASDPGGFANYVAQAPQIIQPGALLPSSHAGGSGGAGGYQAGSVEQIVCQAFGLSPAALRESGGS